MKLRRRQRLPGTRCARPELLRPIRPRRTRSTFTSYESNEEDIRTGVARRGSRDFTAIFRPQDAVHTQLLALWQSGAQRWWRVTYPLANTSNTTRSNEVFTGAVQVASISPPEATAQEPTLLNFTVRVSGNFTYTEEAA